MADDTQLSLDALIWRRCPRCGKDFLRDQFTSSHCKDCHAAYEREKRRRGTPSVAVQRRDDAAQLRAIGQKRCSICFEPKPISEFHGHKGMADRLYPYCKPCESDRNRAGRERRGMAGKMLARASRFGLTVEALEALLAKGRCDACGSTDPGGKTGWHIDHDHTCCDGPKSCGRCVRGVLCSPCNVALGMAGDSPERLEALLRYLATRKA